MLEFLTMAKKGRVYVFGKGEHTINPIHGKDLAEVCVKAIDRTPQEIVVGGPTRYTYRQIAELAFQVLNKQARISTIPLWIKDVVLALMRAFTSVKTYGPIEFLMTALTMDVIGTPYGKEGLRCFFEQHANSTFHSHRIPSPSKENVQYANEQRVHSNLSDSFSKLTYPL
jgi:hypothetical protein